MGREEITGSYGRNTGAVLEDLVGAWSSRVICVYDSRVIGLGQAVC